MLVSLLVSTMLSFGAPAEFLSVLYEQQDPAYYSVQARAWSTYANSSCGDDMSWFHYYKFAQYANRFNQDTFNLSGILTSAEEAGLGEESFSLNYIRHVELKSPFGDYKYLKKANKHNPAIVYAYTGLAAHYELTGEYEKRDSFLSKVQEIRPLPEGVLDYNYNQLESVEPNGLLLTYGDSDTYPSWLLQAVYRHRRDVKVVNWYLLQGDVQYKSRVSDELGVNLTEAETPVQLMDALHKGKRPVYCAITADRTQFGEHREDWFFLTGLALRYEKPGYENLPFLKNAFEHTWRTDRLKQPLAAGPKQALADELNRNYLPSMLELKSVYENSSARSSEIIELIQTIAFRAGVKSPLLALDHTGVVNSLRLASNSVDLSAKQIFKTLVKLPVGRAVVPTKAISTDLGQERIDKSRKVTIDESASVELGESIFMMDTEVSKYDYFKFVQDIVSQQKNEYLDTITVDKVNYGQALYNDPDHDVKEIYAEDRLPVLNVSRRAAELYAQWLTEVYNNDLRKRDGKRMVFRLPTKEEWTYAAAGGRTLSPFPWGGYYYFNGKGCMLANFRTYDLSDGTRNKILQLRKEAKKNDECGSECETPVPVDSYFPNDYGLYNMSGNAAEMVQELGVTMGGSYLDRPEDCVIGVPATREIPNLATGFRLVATYID